MSWETATKMSNYSRHVLYVVIKQALDEATGEGNKNPSYQDIMKIKKLETR